MVNTKYARFVARIEPATGTVAVHDKELGVDHHTPIDAAGQATCREWRFYLIRGTGNT